MAETVIYKSQYSALKFNAKIHLLYLETYSTGYDEDDFNKVLLNLVSFWKCAVENKAKYYMLINLSDMSGQMLPLSFYKNLLGTLNSLSESLNDHLHSVCIISPSSKLAKSLLDTVFAIYTPTRPLVVVDSLDEINDFFSKNTLDD